MSGEDGKRGRQDILTIALKAQEKNHLEEMVRAVLACPALIDISETFATRAFRNAMNLEPGTALRRLAENDPEALKVNAMTESVVAIARLIRSKIEQPPASALSQWEPPEGARQ